MQTARSLWVTRLALGPLFLAAGLAVGYVVRSGPASDVAAPSRAVGVPSLAPLVEQVRDAVVGVRTRHLPAGDPQRGDPVVGGPRVADRLSGDDDAGVSRGTGLVYDPAGLVLTAHHLVVQAASIEIDIPGVGTRAACIVGDDPSTDLAVLRIEEPPSGLVYASLSRADDVRQGDWVFSVGNPANFHSTVCAGVVGYVGRHLRQDGLSVTNEYVQVSGPVRPGNSGSPVFDLHARVIGITTRAAVDAEGLGFALGSRTIVNVLAAMERDAGRVRRAHLGIAFREAPSPADPLVEVDRVAILVTGVVQGLPAEQAGILPGDLILSLDRQPLVSVADFYERVTWSQPGREVRLDVVRGGRRLGDVTVALGELGRPELSQPQ